LHGQPPSADLGATISRRLFFVNLFLFLIDFDTSVPPFYIGLFKDPGASAIEIMRSLKEPKNDPSSGLHGFQPDAVKSPGLTKAFQEIPVLAQRIRKALDILNYKKGMPCLWVVFLGGTGTGKSTLFNALCGAPLSETGVERPKTTGPILYAPKRCGIERNFPLSDVELCHESYEPGGPGAATGSSGRLTILEHSRREFSHLALADTPDLDSIEINNRQFAEDLYLLSDAVVFVTSQEKYADDVPRQFLLRILKEQKLYFLLFNKAEENATPGDFLSTIKSEPPARAKDRLWLIPYTPALPLPFISQDPSFLGFKSCLEQELAEAHVKQLLARILSRRAKEIDDTARRLLDLLQEEQREAEAWRAGLRERCDRIGHRFIQEQEQSFSRHSREFIQKEIRKLFSKYDVLAKPRRAIREIVWTPLRFMGLLPKEDRKEDLLKVRQRIDLVPVQTAVENLNGMVLKELSPKDHHSPLFESMRRAGVALTTEEVRALVFREQERLEQWLEHQFTILSKGIPWAKKWGIYSTSILWGMLIIAFEIVVGGGFSILDAALDSAIAPFVTKGAVELFAYREIQKVARELAKRYQEGLLSVMKEQEKRYEACLDSLLTGKEVTEGLGRDRDDKAV